MPIQVNDNGVLRNVRLIQVNDNGSLRNVYLVQVNDNGVLRNVWLAQINTSLPDGGALDTAAIFRINGDGTYLISTGQTGDWITPKSAAPNYEVRVDVTSGSFDLGAATGEWLDVLDNPTWQVNDPGGTNIKTVIFNISFRPKGGSTQSTQNGIQVQVISTA
jgi:hypothetical protein